MYRGEWQLSHLRTHTNAHKHTQTHFISFENTEMLLHIDSTKSTFPFLTSSTPSTHLGGSFLVTPMAASGSRLIPDTSAMRSSANFKTSSTRYKVNTFHTRTKRYWCGAYLVWERNWESLRNDLHQVWRVVPRPAPNVICRYRTVRSESKAEI